MIRISHVTLPPGLSAFAQRGPDDELNVYVSDTLTADRQRAAVRAALRATRVPGWRTALPAPSVGLLLALGLGWLRRSVQVLRAHAVAWVTASAVAATAAAALYLTTMPHPHGPAGAARPTAPGTSQPPVPGRPAPQPRRTHHARPHRPVSVPTAVPQVAPLSTTPVRPVPTLSTPPSPALSTAPIPLPSPSPSPPPTPPPGGRCPGLLGIKLLGIEVCLHVTL
jgi:hypothetical protein